FEQSLRTGPPAGPRHPPGARHRPAWLGVVMGVWEILVSFWASQRLVSVRAALLIIWVGLLALFNGINQIVLAFELKSAQYR
ncbi:MAG TPA: hypothetical protein VL359_06625, partial [bacterium]|nr:hypothetical protein [bacterium]